MERNLFNYISEIVIFGAVEGSEDYVKFRNNISSKYGGFYHFPLRNFDPPGCII